jgi:hypothetical protein
MDIDLQKWILENQKLSALLVEIQNMDISVQDQAEMAFHRVSEMFKLPKSPTDINYGIENEIDKKSVYEMLGLKKLVSLGDDPRAQVLSSIYYIINNISIDIEGFLEENFGENLSQISGIGFKGENSDVMAIIVGKNESWSDLGCTLFTQSIYL